MGGIYIAKSKTNDLLKAILLGLVLGLVLIYILGTFDLIMPFMGKDPANSGYVSSAPQKTIIFKLIPAAGEANVSDDQHMLARNIIKLRFDEYDNKSWINPIRDEHGVALIIAHFDNISYEDATPLAITPGVFEMRMQATGNESMHVVYGDDVRNVSAPVRQTLANGSTTWCVQFQLTDAGKQKFCQACNVTGVSQDPKGHSLQMLLDGDVIYSCPVSDALADNVTINPADTLYVMTGVDDIGKARAQNIGIFLKYGPLPVKAEVKNP